jgi:hypothetical protein
MSGIKAKNVKNWLARWRNPAMKQKVTENIIGIRISSMNRRASRRLTRNEDTLTTPSICS